MVISVKRCNPETEMILNKLSITKDVKDVTKIPRTQNKMNISHYDDKFIPEYIMNDTIDEN